MWKAGRGSTNLSFHTLGDYEIIVDVDCGGPGVGDGLTAPSSRACVISAHASVMLLLTDRTVSTRSFAVCEQRARKMALMLGRCCQHLESTQRLWKDMGGRVSFLHSVHAVVATSWLVQCTQLRAWDTMTACSLQPPATFALARRPRNSIPRLRCPHTHTVLLLLHTAHKLSHCERTHAVSSWIMS